MIYLDGTLERVTLGRNIANGERPQVVVPAGTWQALRIKGTASEDDWSLLGTTVSPGFDFRDFESIINNSLVESI